MKYSLSLLLCVAIFPSGILAASSVESRKKRQYSLLRSASKEGHDYDDQEERTLLRKVALRSSTRRTSISSARTATKRNLKKKKDKKDKKKKHKVLKKKKDKDNKKSSKAPKDSSIQCIADPYPNIDDFEGNLAGAIECFHEGLGSHAANGSSDGIWYSTSTNDVPTLNLNSKVPWGFDSPPNVPSIIVRPFTEDQIKIALSCSVKNGIRVVPWGKGHNWVNVSSLPNYVLLRLDNICDTSVDHEEKTMTISAGCAVGMQLGKLSLFGENDVNKRLVLNFGCPNIGVSGSFAGGGQGYSSGYLGMQIDMATKVRFMLYDKKGEVKIVEASKKGKYKDLFWAARGGMGGYGIILDITIQSVITPSVDESMTWVDLYVKESGRGAAMYRFQELLLEDKMFGIAQSNSFNADGARLRISYLGPASEAIDKLTEAGLIDNELLDIEGTFALSPEYESFFFKNYAQTCSGSSCTEYNLPTKGVHVISFPNFREFTALAWINPATMNLDNVCGPEYGMNCGPNNGTGTDLQYDIITNQENALKILEMAEEPMSGINNPHSSMWKALPKSIFSSPGHQWRLTEDGWNELAKAKTATTCPHTLLFTHATGGVAAEVASTDTAYPWRGYPLLSYMLGSTNGENCDDWLTAVSNLREEYAVDGFGRGGAYINYPGDPGNCCNAADGQDWSNLYYGQNNDKLQKLRNKYDPYQVYSKPQLPEPKEHCEEE